MSSVPDGEDLIKDSVVCIIYFVSNHIIVLQHNERFQEHAP